MKKDTAKIALFLLAACLCMIFPLTGCSRIKNTSEGLQTPSDNIGIKSDPAAGIDSESGTADAKADSRFAKSFKTVQNNPFFEDIQIELWLAANDAIKAEASGSSETKSADISPMKALSEIRSELVEKEGIHYTEVSSFMGFETKAKYWIRAGKFKKAEESKISVFDGKTYVEYDPIAKTGTRFKKELKSADITLIINSMVPSLSASPYKQQEDKNINGFECSVFFLDMEVLGMKGNTLFIDKQTGMLVKYLMGDDKKGMSNTIIQMEKGGFDSNIFTVPANIAIEDYK